MDNKRVYLAIDLGAGSGRVLASAFDGSRLTLSELNRFDNTPLELPTGWHWNLSQLFQSALEGLAAAANEFGDAPRSVGVDTWGVDYGFLDKAGRLLGLPYQYRDSRTDGIIEELSELIGREMIYNETGIQFMFFNTLYQLYSEVKQQSPVLEIADKLLFMPDIMSYWLSGVAVQERTIASTTQFYNPTTRDWSWTLLEKIGAPKRVFGALTEPATCIGALRSCFKESTGLKNLNVIAVGGHDTASAVAAVPADGGTPCYLSSGTWSLMGIEVPSPIISAQSLADGFTNEIGLGDTVRFLKNICGLWLIQESRRYWNNAGGDYSYARLELLAREAESFRSLIDPDAPVFAKAGAMPEKIQQYCRDTGQPIPETVGQITRCIYESLALKYRVIWNKLSMHSPSPLDCLHIVGGGSRDGLLNQFSANALGKTVYAGPAEATGLGNVLAQMIADGEIANHAEGRAIIRKSFPCESYTPQDTQAWADAFGKFESLIR